MKTYLDEAYTNYNKSKMIYEDICTEEDLNHAGVCLAQAVELAMLYLFETAGASIPETHDIDQIVRLSHEQDIDLFMTRYIANHVEMFALWSDRKDDPDYQVERDKVERALDGVEEYFAFIDLGIKFGQVFTTDLRHEKAARAAIEGLKKSDFRGNIKRAFLFGSCARDDQGYWSDVDIGLVTRPGLLQEKGMDDKYFKLIREMNSKDWEAAELEPHIFYDEHWDEDFFKKDVKRDAKILWINPDYDGAEK